MSLVPTIDSDDLGDGRSRDDWLVFDQFRLSKSRRALFRGAEPVKLRGREFDLLKALTDRPGEFISNEELIKVVWPTSTVSESNLRVQIASLRRVLHDNSTTGRIIVNVTGRGYCLICPIESGCDAAPPSSAVTSSSGARPIAFASTFTQPSTLVGRDVTLNRLVVHLRHRRLITILGSGGIGKTSLATALADIARQDFEDEVYFVDLAAIVDDTMFVSALSVGLDLRVEGKDALAAIFIWLAERKALLILDNCEHVLSAAASFVEQVLYRAPEVSVVCTSREALRIPDEWVQRLGGLEFPAQGNAISAPEALSYTAIELFVERAKASKELFELTDEDATTVSELCRKLDGIPLAIELAAARVDRLKVRSIADMLPEKFDLLGSGKRTAKPHQQTLRTTLDWSYRLLSEREKTTLDRLSIFRNGFTLEAVTSVAGDPEITEIDLIDTLFELIGKSMVFVEATDTGDYYRLFETTRMYAREKLDHSGEFDDVAARHAAFCLHVMTVARDTWASNTNAGWVSVYGRWLDDVTLALDWAYEKGDVELGVQLCSLSAPLAGRLARLREYMGRISLAIDQAPLMQPRDPNLEVSLLAELCYLIFHADGQTPEYLATLAKYDALIADFPELITERERIKFEYGRQFSATNWPVALAIGERLAVLATDIGDKGDLLASGRMRAQALSYLGRHHEAIDAGKFVINESRFAPSTSSAFSRVDVRVSARVAMARSLALMARFDEALEVLNDCFEIADTYRNHPLCQALVMGAIPLAIWRGAGADAVRYLAVLRETASEAGMDIWAEWGRCINLVLAGDRSRLHEIRAEWWIRDDLATFSPMAVDSVMVERALAKKVEWASAEILRADAVRQWRSRAMPIDGVRERLGLAIEIARRQSADLWELRAATDFAGTFAEDGRHDVVRESLGPLLDRLTHCATIADYRRALDMFHSAEV